MTPNRQTVLVTGASRGIGAAIARRFPEEVYSVLTPGREDLDLANPDSIMKFWERLASPVDVLINNAGINIIHPLESIPLDDWEAVLRTNLTAPMKLIQLSVPHMKQQKWGRIVNISSCYSLVSREGRAAYSASKAALNALVRTSALELAPYEILVNAVCPGFIETEMTKRNNTPEQVETIQSNIPMGRLGTSEEIAEMTYFLASPQNSYMTGQCLVVDGGFLCR